jgi:integrase
MRALNEMRAEHAAGELVRPSKLTVGEYLDQWLEANQGRWRPSTASGYAGIVANYLKPGLGAKRLQALTAFDVARAYARWKRDGVGERTLVIIHARLHRAMRQAAQWGLVGRNPVDNVEPPRSTYRRPALWSPEDAARFVGSLDGNSWPGPLFALLLGGGMRFGEACGLRWEDVDLVAATATVGRSRVYVRRTWVEGGPKTAAGVRTVVLPSFAVEVLRAWRRTQAEQRLGAGPDWTGGTRIVTVGAGATPGRWKAGEALKSHARALGLPPLRPHDLRHASASLALSAGVPLPDVSRRLGHANVNITATVYAHAIAKDDRHIAVALERALASGS